MSKVKNAIEARFSNIELSPFKDNEILSLEVNEGISIPFRAKLKFCSKEKLTKAKLKSLLFADLKLTVKQSDAENTVSRNRIFKGIVVSFEDLGIYQQITENSQKKFIYAYELTLMPEIVKLAYKKHSRSFENKKLDEILETVFNDEKLAVDTNKESNESPLFVDKPSLEGLVLSQAQESDLEFVNSLIRSFGLNFNVIYDRTYNNNKYVFSRGWTVDTGEKVYESKVQFQGNDLGQDVSSNVIEANYFDGQDSFASHFIYDLKSDGSADFESVLNGDTTPKLSSNLDNYLFLGNLSDKRKSELRSYYEDASYCLNKSLSEKVIVKVSDLVYTPGSKFTLKQYSEDEKFIIVRDALTLKVKNTDYNNPEYELTQTCLGFLVKTNDEKRKLLGSVVDVARISHSSGLSDCVLVPVENTKGAAVALSQSNVNTLPKVNDSFFVVGTVCDKDGKTANYTVKKEAKEGEKEKEETVYIENTILPVSGGSIPRKFYLKVSDADGTNSSDSSSNSSSNGSSDRNTPVVVDYLSQVSGNTSNYISSFPRVGQKVAAIKVGNSYIFYAYLPQEDDIDVIDEKLQKSNLSGASFIDYKNSKESYADFDIGVKGLDFKHFDSIEDKFRYLILNDDVDNFMCGVSIRRNDLTIYENFNDKKTTIKQLYPNELNISLAAKCLSLPNELKQTRNNYKAALKEGKAVNDSDEKKNLENVYKDLTAAAEKLMHIISKTDVTKDAEDKLKGILSTSQSTLNSDGDLKLAAKNDLEIDAKNLTLRVKGNINISADGTINLISEKKVAVNTGSALFEVSPRSINSKIRRVWKCDLPYDSNISVSNTGVSMTGMSTSMSGLLSSSLKDGFGGKVSIASGSATLSGTPVTITTPKKRAVAFNIANLSSNILGLLNFATTYSNKKGAKVSVAAIQKGTSSSLKIVEDVFKKIEDRDQYKNQEIDGLSFFCSCVTDAVDILQAAYDLVEAIVLASLDENGKAKKSYITRNRSNFYMSPQDCVKNSMFYFKGIFAMIPAVAAMTAIIRDGKKSTVKVLSDKIKVNTNEFDNQSLKNSFKNSVVNGSALPSQPPVGGNQPNQNINNINNNQQISNAQVANNSQSGSNPSSANNPPSGGNPPANGNASQANNPNGNANP